MKNIEKLSAPEEQIRSEYEELMREKMAAGLGRDMAGVVARNQVIRRHGEELATPALAEFASSTVMLDPFAEFDLRPELIFAVSFSPFSTQK
jgi:hypothetical protein